MKAVPERLCFLLDLGRPKDDEISQDRSTWRDYVALGLLAEDMPSLLALATDKSYMTRREPEFYTPIHAWRALATLGSCEVVPGLIETLDWRSQQEDDWILEDFPAVLSSFGENVLPLLEAALRDHRLYSYARTSVSEAMAMLAEQKPDLRERVVSALAEQVRNARFNTKMVNEIVISNLIDLRAVETKPIIKT
jgi:hypothetical protein